MPKKNKKAMSALDKVMMKVRSGKKLSAEDRKVLSGAQDARRKSKAERRKR